LIKAAKAACNLTIIVGGGIRDGNSAKKAIEAGADWIVTGNLTEQYEDHQLLQEILNDLIKKMN
jgi:phosphoglycerol geranylgeranyltransferase